MSACGDIWAVVPVKELGRGKSRLGPAWTGDRRRHLSAAMLRDVLTALTGAGGLAGIRVVSRDPAVARIAAAFGAETEPGPAMPGPTAAVAGAARRLAQCGRRGMLAVMADLPLLTAADVAHVLERHAGGVSLVPARDGRGCNMALLTPPDAIALTFDGAGLAGHLRLARERGLAVRRHDLAGPGLDIDTAADLARFQATPSDTATAACLGAAVTEGAA